MRGRTGSVAALVLAAAVPANVCAQDAKPAPITHEKERSRTDLLRESYAIGADLVPSQRALLLFQLASAAGPIAPNLSKQWAKDLFNLTFQLDPDWNRSALQKNAVAVLANADPAGAFRMLEMMSPLPNQTMLGEDLRADAARTVFLLYWNQHRSPGRLAEIRTRSAAIAQDGQYPFLAVSPMLHDSLRRDEPAGLAWFSEISMAYGQGSANIRSSNPDFVAFLRDFWPTLTPAAKREALTPLVSKLTQPDADASEWTYRSSVKTSAGAVVFSSRNDQLLFQVMPLVRELDAKWADRLAQDRPALSRAAGAATEEVQQAYVTGNASSSDQAAAAAEALGRQGQLSRVYDALGKGPGEALQMAGQLGDPHTQLLALGGIARGLEIKDTSSSVTVEEQAKRALEASKDPLDKLRALALLAQSTGRVGHTASFVEYMNRGFDLGELLFEEFVQTHPTADVEGAEVIGPLGNLVETGMRFRRFDTLARVERCSNRLLTAYLLIAAAGGDDTAKE